MAFGSGVSWEPILAAAQAHSKHRAQLQASSSTPSSQAHANPSPVTPAYVPDVSEQEGLLFFRPSAVNGASHGSYLAIPLVGVEGQVRDATDDAPGSEVEAEGGTGGRLFSLIAHLCRAVTPLLHHPRIFLHSSQVLGLLGVDTIAASVAASAAEVGAATSRSVTGGAGSGARQLSRADVDYIKALAAAASDAIIKDQDKLADVMLQV